MENFAGTSPKKKKKKNIVTKKKPRVKKPRVKKPSLVKKKNTGLKKGDYDVPLSTTSSPQSLPSKFTIPQTHIPQNHLPYTSTLTPRKVNVPKQKLTLNANKTSYTEYGPTSTSELRCWANEQIANINDNNDHYTFDCYNINNTKTASPWRCQVSNNWSKEGDPDSLYITRKNELGYVECGSLVNNGDCKRYTNISDCEKDVKSGGVYSSRYKCNDLINTNPSNGKNMYHWCTLNYEELTKASYK